MSVGGKVIETIVLPEKVWVNTREPQSGDECAIYVERTPQSRTITPGDSLWWQSNWAFWTPVNRAFSDYRLNRVGFSGVARPTPTDGGTECFDHNVERMRRINASFARISEGFASRG